MARPDVPVREAVLWHETSRAAAPPTSPLADELDVAIVGGGYCGLAAAHTLAAAGRDAAVLEAGPLGAGASMRNGGMVIPELKAGPGDLVAAHGDLGRRMQADVDEAFDWTEAVIAAEGIDCAYERSGQLFLASGESHAPALEDLAAQHRAIGHDAQVVRGADLAAEIGSSRFPAGVVIARTGGLQPARYHAGLAERAARAGATFHPFHRATGIARDGTGFRVEVVSEGRRRSVHARSVLLATNAYADAVEPRLARRVLPMGSFIIATEPLSAEQADAVLPTRRMCFDSKNLLWYWRLDDERRMVFGGRRRLGRVTLAEAAGYLRRSMVSVHPQLADVVVDCVWGGDVALTLDRLPHVGCLDGVWYATGCNGSGVALNTWMGHRLGEVLLGVAPPSFAELPHRPIPLHSRRSAYLPVVSRWFQWQDSRA